MECFQVLEEGEGIERSIARSLSAWGGPDRPPAGEDRAALLVISPRAAAKGLPLPGPCRTVLLPGDAGTRFSSLRASSAVSYGVSPKDSLTISSREGARLWAALQRELVTLDGQVVERQEFPLRLSAGEDPLCALAAAGALLLLGVPPEALSPP